MKKKIMMLSAAAILVVSIVVYTSSCNNAKASSIASEPEKTSLSDYGFINVPSEKKNIVNRLENEFTSKTGLKFLSDDSITVFCNMNGLMISEAANFKAEIPNENKKQIVSNYNRLKPVKHYYYDNFWQQYHQVGVDKYGNKDPFDRKGIMVVAPPELFNENAFIKKDPIALVKVDGGWLELSRW